MESFRDRFRAILPVVLIKEREAPNSGNESHYGGIRKNSEKIVRMKTIMRNGINI